ncbi:MAG: DUF4097 family beta strand repeat-containing protein [Candidatus Izemoplasmatales bacterium]
MKILGRISLGIFLVGLGLVIAGLIAGGTGAFHRLTDDDFILVDETYDVGTLELVKLVFANKRIDVVPSETDQIRIVYYETAEDPVVVTEDATSLAFEEELDFGFEWFDFQWLWPISPEYYGCTLYLPADAVLSLDLTTSNGGIDIAGMTALTGIDAYTSNGEINLLDVDVAGDLEMVSSNGAFDVENVTAFGKVTFRTSNGKISIDGLVALGEVVLKTSNGPVDVDGLVADDLEVDTSNGRIDVAIVGDYAHYRILMETSNGDMYIDGEEKNDGRYNTSLEPTIDLDTSNGDVRLNFID